MSDPETIVISIIAAKGLPKTDMLGTIDSYFIFKYGETSKQTETKKNTQNPTFNETFDFEYNESIGDAITVELWDWDKVTKNDLIATAQIQINDFKNKKKTKWFTLSPVEKKIKKAGEVQLEVIFNANVPEVAERSYDAPSGSLQEAVVECVKSHAYVQQILNFLYKGLIWENIIWYIIIAVVAVVDYFLVVTTEWRTLPYILVLSAQFYVIYFILTSFTKYLGQPDDEVEASSRTVINNIFSLPECLIPGSDPLQGIKPLEKFQQTPYYIPVAISALLLLLALIGAIFSGGFIAFVTVFGLLLWPGIRTKGYDQKFVEWWVPTVWTPHLQPLYENKVKPQIDKILHGGSGAAPPAEVDASAPSS